MNLTENNPHIPHGASPDLDRSQQLELRRLQQIWEMRKTKHPTLNGQGFVRLVDASGTDDRIIEAARLTAQSEGKSFQDDRTLLRYLIRHQHATPIEFAELTIHLRIPMDAWRQFVRLTEVAA